MEIPSPSAPSSPSSYFQFDDFMRRPLSSPTHSSYSPVPAFDDFVLPPVPAAFDDFVVPSVPAFGDFVLPPGPSFDGIVQPSNDGLIPGMKFRPTDEEVVVHYVRPFVLGCADLGGPIAYANVYDYEPQQLSGLAKDHGDGRMFFFTEIKKIGKSKTHRSIKSNKGFWRPTQSPTAIKGKSGNTIGYKTPLVYYGNKQKTKWLMQEYKLEPRNSSHELVVVVIYYHHTKAKAKANAHNHNHD